MSAGAPVNAHGAGGQVDDRLVVDEQVAVVEGAAQPGTQTHPVEPVRAQSRIEGHYPVLARLLGRVEREVGIAQGVMGFIGRWSGSMVNKPMLVDRNICWPSTRYGRATPLAGHNGVTCSTH